MIVGWITFVPIFIPDWQCVVFQIIINVFVLFAGATDAIVVDGLLESHSSATFAMCVCLLFHFCFEPNVHLLFVLLFQNFLFHEFFVSEEENGVHVRGNPTCKIRAALFFGSAIYSPYFNLFSEFF